MHSLGIYFFIILGFCFALIIFRSKSSVFLFHLFRQNSGAIFFATVGCLRKSPIMNSLVNNLASSIVRSFLPVMMVASCFLFTFLFSRQVIIATFHRLTDDDLRPRGRRYILHRLLRNRLSMLIMFAKQSVYVSSSILYGTTLEKLSFNFVFSKPPPKARCRVFRTIQQACMSENGK